MCQVMKDLIISSRALTSRRIHSSEKLMPHTSIHKMSDSWKYSEENKTRKCDKWY